jgi:polyribonucleotide nucleotidyltransferase
MIKQYEIKLGKSVLRASFPNWAENANGSCLVTLGETSVFATVLMSNQKTEQDFFPLTVEYLERYYARGKIGGSRYIRREGRPSDEAILNARLIDRAIRPLFPEEFKQEVQVIATVLSWDGKNDPDIPAMIATSLALAVSEIPWQGPIAALRVAGQEKGFYLNPTYEEKNISSFEVVFSAIPQEEEMLLNMIEGGFQETKEEELEKAFEWAIPFLKELYSWQTGIIKEIGKKKIELKAEETDQELAEEVKKIIGNSLEEIIFIKDRKERAERMNLLKEEVALMVQQKRPGDEKSLKKALALVDQEFVNVFQNNILKKEKRPDGRSLNELRPIAAQVSVIPRTHGSGLFMRGQTKTLSILTLGAPGDTQLLEGMEIVGEKRFMHHYNFPPYAPGEIKPLRGPGRREIGHGMLVEKALLPVIPTPEQFPYTMRIVTEVLSSNGSTSMASVSSASLALMDAGVPIKTPVAGISIGLVKQGKEYKILKDIQGPEDHYGDMDFKVAGTKNGITAIQMDVKIKGIEKEIFKKALFLAKEAREEILNLIEKVIPEPRKELSVFAPRIQKLTINPEKIKDLIGPSGKTINKIIAATKSSIDIEEDGTVYITAENEELLKKTVEEIRQITREPKIGEVFEGKVKKIYDFGAMVEFLPGEAGLIHISELAPFRVKKINDIIKVGDVVPVKIISIDEQGRFNLSLKEAQKKGNQKEAEKYPQKRIKKWQQPSKKRR